MKPKLLLLVLLLTSVVWAQNTKYIDKKSTNVSGTPISLSNELGGMTASFGLTITGSPTSSSILIQGCKTGITTCHTLQTYTANVTDIVGPALDTIYDYFVVTPTWSGGTLPTVTVSYTVTIARSGSGGSGGAVTSVAGHTGVVTLVEGDIASLPTDLTARELIANKDTDVTLAANSDTKYASQKAIKAYVASQLGGGFYQTIQSGGTPATQRAATNFGSEFTVTDNVTKTDITINAIAESKVTGLPSDLAGKASTTHTHAESDVTNLLTDLGNRLPLSGGVMTGGITFVGGQTFPGTAATSHTHAASDIASGTVATARLGSGTASASTILFGDQTYKSTIPCSAMPTLTGDATNSNCAMTVVKLNGVLLSGLGTGILKNTTGTGTPSIAVAADFPTLNQNTVGNANTASALASTPTQCSGSNFSQGIAANGNANCATPSGSSPLTQLGDTFTGGVSGASTAIHPPSSPDGLTYTYTSTPASGAATQSAWGINGVPVHSKSNASYTIDYTDRTSLVWTTNNTTATAVTIPVSGSTNFANNFVFVTCNIGTVTSTVTATTPSKLNAVTAGNFKLLAYPGTGTPACGHVWSDNTDFYSEVILPTDINGRLAAVGFPAISGDGTVAAGTLSLTVTKLNGILLSGLGTGILKNTTATGVPSIAVAADFPTLNQSTTGNSATATAFDHTPTLGTTSQLCRGIDASGACVPLSILPTAMFPAISGDVTINAGALTAVVTKLNGTLLSGLATGILKNTTTTGVPSIATAADVDSLYTGSGKCYLFKGTTPGTNDGCDNPTGTGDFSTNTATSVDSEIVLFSSTTGKLAKRATGTGYVKVSSGVYQTPAATIPNVDLANSAVTVNGQTCTLGSSCNANSGAGAHSVALNQGNGSAQTGVGPAATDMILASVNAADPVYKSPADLSKNLYVAGGGTAQAQTVTLVPAAGSLSTGLFVRWKPTAANTGAAPTLAVNGTTATAITKCGTVALVANDLTTTAVAQAIYDGTQYQLLNPQAVGCPNVGSGAITATQLATQYSKGKCVVAWGGSGTSFALVSGDDALANNTCYNDSGVTYTITALKCRGSGVSNTTTINPTFGSAGTGTTILSGALTCGSSLAYSSTGTVSNASWTTGSGINPVMGGTLTGTSIGMIVEYTY